jgi:hypothetical protein
MRVPEVRRYNRTGRLVWRHEPGERHIPRLAAGPILAGLRELWTDQKTSGSSGRS